MKNTKISFRSDPRPDDPMIVQEIVQSTGFFHESEIDIAVELIDERLSKGPESEYYFLFTDVENETVGYSCFGPIPATQSSFDLYWIAVHAKMRGQGIGKALLKESEEAIRNMGGHQIYIETSGRDLYIPTRQFYIACQYEEAAVFTDFYAPGDAKYVYVKVV